MNIELVVFSLRLLAGLSLVGFLLTLFFIILRNTEGADRPSRTSQMRGLTLRQIAPGDRNQPITLGTLTTLGRAASNTIVIDDDFASAEHARIVAEKDQFWLEDQRSRNGTRLNDEPIARRTILAEGDIIDIGKHRYRIDSEE